MKREKTNGAGGRIQEDQPAKPKPRTTPGLEWLQVRYTMAERLDLAEKLARCQSAIEQAEDQKKATDAQHKDLVTRLETERRSLTRKLTAGGEMRNVDCTWLLGDPTPTEKTLVRMDTGEVVRTVPMIGTDFQEEIPETLAAAESGEGLVLEPPPAPSEKKPEAQQ